MKSEKNKIKKKSAEIIPLYEYLKDHPGYSPRWKLRYDPDGNFRACYNPEFGRIYVAAVVETGEGGPERVYDQPIIEEAKTGLIICPFYAKGEGIFLGLVEITRPIATLENSLEFPRCFGEQGKDILEVARQGLKKEGGEVEIINCLEGGRLYANTTFFKTSIQIVFAEIKPQAKNKSHLRFYEYPEEVEKIKENNEIKCALTLAALSVFDAYRRSGKL